MLLWYDGIICYIPYYGSDSDSLLIDERTQIAQEIKNSIEPVPDSGADHCWTCKSSARLWHILTKGQALLGQGVTVVVEWFQHSYQWNS